MIEIVALPSRVTVLGRLGENEHRLVKFPISDYSAMYPNATYTLLNLRPGDATAYPVANTAVQGGYLLWTVASTDLTKEGQGKCELLVTDGDVVAKSVIYLTSVLPALDGSGTAPEPWESWQTVFAGMKDEAVAAAAEATAASEAVQDMGVEASTLTPGSAASVTKTVDPSTRAVTLTFGIPEGEKGDTGDTGETGPTGNGIQSITLNADYTLTITYTNGQSYTTGSIRGAQGAQGDPGQPGQDGADGYSPTVTVTDITGGHRMTITDASGVHTFDVMDGETPTVPVQDVQVNGTSILSNGVANVPVATDATAGAVIVGNGLEVDSNNKIKLILPSANEIKAGQQNWRAINPNKQHISVFYGLAKSAGDTTQSQSNNAVGTYTDDAKSAISEMLSGAVSVSGSTPSITAKPGIRYICGECATLDITTPATGIVDVVFESGSTATVLTVTPPTGMTMKWANGFDPTALEANAVYAIHIINGFLGSAISWT